MTHLRVMLVGVAAQSAGTPLRVCKSVCIEEKITEREVADYVASEE